MFKAKYWWIMNWIETWSSVCIHIHVHIICILNAFLIRGGVTFFVHTHHHSPSYHCCCTVSMKHLPSSQSACHPTHVTIGSCCRWQLASQLQELSTEECPCLYSSPSCSIWCGMPWKYRCSTLQGQGESTDCKCLRTPSGSRAIFYLVLDSL